MIKFWQKKNPQEDTAHAIYHQASTLARDPSLFINGGITDDFDGRFEALIMTLSVVMQRVFIMKDNQGNIRQILADILVADLDDSLRASGVGDMGISRRVKKRMALALGRAESYHEALMIKNQSKQHELLLAALRRNPLRNEMIEDVIPQDEIQHPTNNTHSYYLTDWMLNLQSQLAALDDQDFLTVQWRPS